MPNKTPFFAQHEKLNAALTDFHDWMLPMHYGSPIAEHNAVRQQCGLFDTSHMGEIEVQGKDAEKLLQSLLVRDISAMKAGQIRLAAMCNEDGGIMDDLTVYKFSGEKFWLVVNAGPYESDLLWIKRNAKGVDAKAEGLRSNTAKLDLQGPKAERVLQKLVKENLNEIKYYNFKEMQVADVGCIASRSGYTGEDGFELYFDSGSSEKVWNALMQAGKEFGLMPCGLAARDSLRLEAGMLLYGQDIDSEHSILLCPYEKIVSWNKGFFGKRALVKQRRLGVREKLIGFELVEKGIARHGCEILVGEKKAGIATSAGFSPTLKKSIGLGYIAKEFGEIGQEIEIDIRGKRVKAKVVDLPFYRR
ncbi:MAG: glycine cleavage system aminomethyltransferase GcvT [Candidatus Diapherotrites archaeon]|nr:glycine cleavage system aminomethyltransferase GcvT [Candidatus Diapherotrites archaeon]